MDRKHWHPAFCGAAELELRANRSDLIFESEHELSKKPLRIDLLIIKKNKNAVIKNEIGRLFRGYNLCEFKGLSSGLSIDDFFKVIGYAGIYKSLGKHVDEIPAEEITLTFIRNTYPRALFKRLRDLGIGITEEYPGVFYLTGNMIFKTQIIVTSALDEEKHSSLRILTDNAMESDVRRFLTELDITADPGDRYNADAVLHVSVSANPILYTRIQEDEEMCEPLKEIMKDEFDRVASEARAEGRTEGIINCILGLLEDLGNVTDHVRQILLAENDPKVLERWTKLAAHSSSIEEFEQAINA